MTAEKETRLLIVLIFIGYLFNFCFGILGSFFSAESLGQLIFWQFGDTMAIMASVLAGRQVGSRGQSLASAGYTMLAITYGVSFGSSSISAVNSEKMATVLLPLIPAIVLITFCRIFPPWLRFGSLLIIVPFFLMYQNMINQTYKPGNISNVLAYSGIQLLGVLWAYYIWRDYEKMKKS